MAKKYMPGADNVRHVARPVQGPAKGPARKPGASRNTTLPGWNAGRKTLPRT